MNIGRDQVVFSTMCKLAKSKVLNSTMNQSAKDFKDPPEEADVLSLEM